MTKNNFHPNYRPDIDGLRAIAVLSVVTYHAFPNWMRGGFTGVDIFFVISGFLISTILFENLDKGTFGFLDFYIRRIRRIFPALIIVMGASIALGWLALLAGEYKQLGKHIIAGAGFASNFVLWSETSYFDIAAEKKPLLHLWSLAIEEQFYVAWPITLWLAWKFRVNFLTLTLIALLISFSLNLKGIKSDPAATFYLPQTRIWELLCGGVLAWFFLYKKDAFRKERLVLDHLLARAIYRDKVEVNGRTLENTLSALGFLLIAYGFWRINKELPFPGKWAAIPVVGAALVISAGPRAWFNRKFLSNGVAVWFGLISFPLYLWHWPMLVFARLVENETPSLGIRIIAIIFSIFLAWVTYRFIERPFRLSIHSGRKASALVLLLAAIACLGYYLQKNDGYPDRLDSLRGLNSIIEDPLPQVNDIDCGRQVPELSKLQFDGGCRLSKNEAPSIVFVGDSHTAHYRNAVWDRFSDKPILMVVATSCLPFSSSAFMTGECKEKYTSIIDYLERSKSVETVVLSGYWAYLMSGGFDNLGDGWRNARAPTKDNLSTFEENASEFLGRLLKAGKSVVFLKDIPDLDFNIGACFDNRPIRISTPKIRQDCSIDEREFLSRMKTFDSLIDKILQSFPEVKIYDPRPLFCSNGKCYGSNGELPYYFNGDHVNHFGAKLVIDGLIDYLHPEQN